MGGHNHQATGAGMGLMTRVAESLRNFQEIDKRLLELAVQNSNVRAYSLAFGPAMKLF